ncbi:MAG: UbiX family flavin prenyltransferase [Chloroflexi bacterium]|nr:UbiX family flavin prenyltransferase [Chloroflexota bacterium]
MRLVVGISGASGAIYGVRVMEALHRLPDVETHLVMSDWAQRIIEEETDYTAAQVAALASHCHHNRDLAAPVSSGSFLTEGMVVVPCSMKTLSAIANSYSDSLLIRAADVVLKEGRKLVLVVRESPFHLGHLKLMTDVAQMGGVILPPVPAFYHRPQTVEDIVAHTVGRILDQWRLSHGLYRPWAGPAGD